MLFFGVLSLLLVAASGQKCYKNVTSACERNDKPIDGITLPECSAKYGSIALNVNNFETGLQKFAVANLHESFHLLYLSTYFGNYKVNREGFKKLYRHYSDKLWEDAIDIMKYLTKRGGKMNFQHSVDNELHIKGDGKLTTVSELGSLGLVLDHMKVLAKAAFEIHASHSGVKQNDPAIAHYIEEKFLESHTQRIRDLAGYITELKELSYTNSCHPTAVFLFDEFLQKSL
ncbi:ferritin 2 light chain [Megalopta genalis]|uniref:ferritin 2 light chain n=1 Tax=Megalopta genalis TaxID=115081 RepID=UPI0014434EA7|nr:ferritin, lower subunit [Megalopta genalis]XP_033323976.1 ferritin, lower subunit [Megalopta genalis]